MVWEYVIMMINICLLWPTYSSYIAGDCHSWCNHQKNLAFCANCKTPVVVNILEKNNDFKTNIRRPDLCQWASCKVWWGKVKNCSCKWVLCLEAYEGGKSLNQCAFGCNMTCLWTWHWVIAHSAQCLALSFLEHTCKGSMTTCKTFFVFNLHLYS